MRAPKFQMKKKTAVLVAAGVLTVGTAGGAYAFWSTTGGGAGTGTTAGGDASALAVSGSVANAMFPGDTAQTVTAVVTNNGHANYKLQTLTAYVTTDKTGCTGADYLINGNAAPSDAAHAVGLGITPVDLAPTGTASKSFTMQFNNTGDNQDACMGAAVTINYIAS